MPGPRSAAASRAARAGSSAASGTTPAPRATRRRPRTSGPTQVHETVTEAEKSIARPRWLPCTSASAEPRGSGLPCQHPLHGCLQRCVANATVLGPFKINKTAPLPMQRWKILPLQTSMPKTPNVNTKSNALFSWAPRSRGLFRREGPLVADEVHEARPELLVAHLEEVHLVPYPFL